MILRPAEARMKRCPLTKESCEAFGCPVWEFHFDPDDERDKQLIKRYGHGLDDEHKRGYCGLSKR